MKRISPNLPSLERAPPIDAIWCAFTGAALMPSPPQSRWLPSRITQNWRVTSVLGSPPGCLRRAPTLPQQPRRPEPFAPHFALDDPGFELGADLRRPVAAHADQPTAAIRQRLERGDGDALVLAMADDL